MTQLPDMQRIKQQISIESALAHYGAPTLKVSGTGRVGPCLVHDASKTSRAFHISADGRAWYCFGACQRGGSVIDLVAAIERCSIKEAAIILAQRFALD